MHTCLFLALPGGPFRIPECVFGFSDNKVSLAHTMDQNREEEVTLLSLWSQTNMPPPL
jgi:hypothetical protein